MNALVCIGLLIAISCGICAEAVTYSASIVRLSGDNPVLGGFLRRKCSATPATEPWRYKWSHPDGTTSTGQYLSVDYLQKSQMGKYTCVAKTPKHTMVDHTFVYPSGQNTNSNTNPNTGSTRPSEPSPEANVDIRSMSGEKLVYGGSIRRECTVDQPGWNVYWYYPNGRRENSPYLIIHNIKESDVGRYRCVAEQRSTGATRERFFDIGIGKEADNLNIVTLPGESLKVGGTLRRQCVSSSPQYEIYWTLPSGRRVYGSYLTVYNLKASDSGKYICQAENRRYGGRMMAWFSFTLSAPTEWTKLNVDTMPDQDLRIGGVLSQRCSVTRSGWDIYWQYPNGGTVRGEILRVRNLSRRDFGRYWCVARNRSNGQEIRGWYQVG